MLGKPEWPEDVEDSHLDRHQRNALVAFAEGISGIAEGAPATRLQNWRRIQEWEGDNLQLRKQRRRNST